MADEEAAAEAKAKADKEAKEAAAKAARMQAGCGAGGGDASSGSCRACSSCGDGSGCCGAATCGSGCAGDFDGACTDYQRYACPGCSCCACGGDASSGGTATCGASGGTCGSCCDTSSNNSFSYTGAGCATARGASARYAFASPSCAARGCTATRSADARSSAPWGGARRATTFATTTCWASAGPTGSASCRGGAGNCRSARKSAGFSITAATDADGRKSRACAGYHSGKLRRRRRTASGRAPTWAADATFVVERRAGWARPQPFPPRAGGPGGPGGAPSDHLNNVVAGADRFAARSAHAGTAGHVAAAAGQNAGKGGAGQTALCEETTSAPASDCGQARDGRRAEAASDASASWCGWPRCRGRHCSTRAARAARCADHRRHHDSRTGGKARRSREGFAEER